jgi:hypothetical protein
MAVATFLPSARRERSIKNSNLCADGLDLAGADLSTETL